MRETAEACDNFAMVPRVTPVPDNRDLGAGPEIDFPPVKTGNSG
jgi:hypothetical protein